MPAIYANAPRLRSSSSSRRPRHPTHPLKQRALSPSRPEAGSAHGHAPAPGLANVHRTHNRHPARVVRRSLRLRPRSSPHRHHKCQAPLQSPSHVADQRRLRRPSRRLRPGLPNTHTPAVPAPSLDSKESVAPYSTNNSNMTLCTHPLPLNTALLSSQPMRHINGSIPSLTDNLPTPTVQIPCPDIRNKLGLQALLKPHFRPRSLTPYHPNLFP